MASIVDYIRRYRNIPLYYNALYLIIGNVTGALLGFVFWFAAARLYPPEAVGVASAGIAAMGMLGMLSHMGYGLGLIRFLPDSGDQAPSMINACLTISALTAVAVSGGFLLGLEVWSPGLMPLRENALSIAVFIGFTIATAWGSIIDNAMTAGRRSLYTMLRGSTFSVLKLALVVGMVVTAAGFSGIFNAWGIAMAVSIVIGAAVFLPHVRPGYRPGPDFCWRGKGEMTRYSLVNNVSAFFWSVPGLLLPIIVLARLGAEVNGYFYIGWTIASALSMVPLSISTSLFAEGSHDEKELTLHAWRSLGLVLMIMTPLVVVVGIFADRVLHLFGAAYPENATGLLRLLALGLLPAAVNQLYFGMLRVQKKLKALALLTGSIAATILAVSVLLMPGMGIKGVGAAFLGSQTAAALWVVFSRGRAKLVARRMSSIILKRERES